jgi:uncharacterized membrane protein HdeD (DUF308 family)
MLNDSPTSGRIQTALAGSLQAHWKLFLVEGIILVLLGVGALAVPQVATIAIAVLVGWLLLISGIVGLISTFAMRRAPGFWWSLLSALVGTAAGVVLLRWPINGAFSLTVILTVFLTLEGVITLMYAFEHRRGLSGRWGMMLLSGIVDLALAGMIVTGLPGTAAWAIGLLVGINLIFGGSALIAMALHARR